MKYGNLKKQMIKFGLIAGILHTVLLLFFFGYITSDQAERSQSAFYWLVWFIIDFPVSYLLTSQTSINILKSVLMTNSMNVVYLFFHGIFGAFWWSVFIGFVYYFFNTRLIKN